MMRFMNPYKSTQVTILLKPAVCVVFLCSAFLAHSSAAADPERQMLKIKASPDIRYQVIDGFGASDAWRVQFVGANWPLAKRNRIADLLFSQENDAQGNPKGIGLSLWRFYLSSGTAEQGDASGIGNRWRRGPCFLKADGSYDWLRHEGQQWFLRAAKARGVERLLAFVNAPPVHLSRNGKGYATKGDDRLNLKSGCMDDYADYLVDVLEHLSGTGLHFDYLSPVNEPQWDWDDGSQEGTPALNEEVYCLVRYLSDRMSKRGLTTQIVIGEAGTIGHACMPMDYMGLQSDGRDDQARFFFSESSPFYIGNLPNVKKTLSAHSYHSVWPVDKQIAYRHMVSDLLNQANPDLGYWMSEYCILQENDEIGGGHGRDLTMKTALYVARIIHHDLVICNAQSWQWWTALSQCDYKDGLIYLDDGSQGARGRMGPDVESLICDGQVRQSKLLWVLGNYSRFVRPGMRRIQCAISPKQSAENGLLVSAYSDGASGLVVYVFANLSTEAKYVTAGTDRRVKTYITDETRDMSCSVQRLDNLEIPPRAVMTVLEEN